MIKRLLCLACFTLVIGTYFSQQGFYSTDTIREIKIYFEEENWDYILDSLYVEGLENRLLSTAVIDGIQLDSIGIRYKGFSSVSTNRTKNPFNLDLDYVIDDQNYEGYDKIKLSNVIQDPSFIREVLSYEVARNYMPASRANFANVYINDTLWGLYTNVEAVNKDWLDSQFDSKTNTFVKGNPDALDLNGENSNLEDHLGTDPLNYTPYYDLKSDYGWSRLYEFIDTLNNHTSSIENVLNVDRALWMHAFNYSVVNFDSYIGYAQNYYLYEDDHGRFNPILWDMNMSFGSFRLTDDSDYWSGFTIPQAMTIDPLAHYNSVSLNARPLMRNLFNNDRYRKMYMAHIRTIIDENFASGAYALRGQDLQNMIDASVLADTNKFYSYADFQDNLTMTVSDLIDYPGITELMDARSIYLMGLEGYSGEPTIDTITPAVSVGLSADITVQVSDGDEVILAYRYGSQDLFKKLDMYDDGLHNDGAAGDNIYGVEVPSIGNVFQYYFYAENDSAGTFSPARAAFEYYTIESQLAPMDIVINEFMAWNTTTIPDNNGEYDDWIELYNNKSYPISTKGLYLSDDPTNPTKWSLPDVVVQPNRYMMIWADDDDNQQGYHANFSLLNTAEHLSLAYDDGSVLDSLTFDFQYEDFTTGRLPNGTGAFQYLYPTFNGSNSFTALSDISKLEFSVYPNPAANVLNIQLNENHSNVNMKLMSIEGKEVYSGVATGINSYQISLPDLANGMYLLEVKAGNKINTESIIINHNR